MGLARIPGFISGSYTLRQWQAECQRCLNLYPEMDEMGTAANQEKGILTSTPGLTLLGAIGTGPIRGLFPASDGNLYCVSGKGLYQVSSSWAGTLLGPLGTSAGRVQFSDNGAQLCVVDGQGYVWTFTPDANTAQFLSLDGVSGWQGSNIVAYLDQWGIFAVPGTSQFYTSNQLDFTTYNGTSVETSPNYAYKAGFSDPIVSIMADHSNVWIFGSQTTEVWYDAQSAPPGIVLSRIPGSILEIGCCSPYSPCQVMNQMLWLGDGRHGAGVVWMAQGYAAQPIRVSTHAVEEELLSYGYVNLQQATSWSYEQDGHGFYCLNVPGAPVTWVYDVMARLWHERAALVAGQDSRHIADCHAWWNGTHVVGDYQTGNLYALDQENYTDNGAAKRWMRKTPHMADNNLTLYFQRVQLEMEVGIGLDGAGQGSSPQVMMRYSDDAGMTWSTERWAPAGAIGGYLTRCKWDRCGKSRNRVWEFSGSDPVSWTLFGGEVQITQGLA